ncbi:MAG: glycosyltransferase [Psychroflexus sp.]
MKFILFLFLISILYILVQHYNIAFKLLKQKKSFSSSLQNTDPVSIIICAKNEASNLSQNLIPVLEQDYPQFEVIVVDDKSTDSTSDIVQKFQKEFSNLKLLKSIAEYSNSKRSALKQGIEASQHSTLLLTDADCRPISKNWISTMKAELSGSKSCVLGYSPHIRQSSFLNLIIQFETLQTAGLYLAQAIDNKAYMSVGRNVMYTKELFLKSEKFDNEKDLTSGDDDLLIQNIEDKSNISVCLIPESFVLSKPKVSWSAWWKQKLRHYSTAAHYDTKSQLFLGTYHFSHLIFWIGFLILAFSKYSKTVLMIFVVSILIKSLFMIAYMRVLKVSKEVLFLWPILEVSLLLLQLGLGIQGKLQKQKTWQ